MSKIDVVSANSWHIADNPAIYEPARNNNFEFLIMDIDRMLRAGVLPEEAEANDKINKSLTDQLISYNQMLRWDGKLPTFMGSDTMIPVLDFTGAE